MKRFVLPELDYGYSALEPHVSRRVLELHHRGHHAAAVRQANEISAQMEEARAAGDFDLWARLEPKLTFNVAAHIMHSLFWKNLRPRGGGLPTGRLHDRIVADFGAFEALKHQLDAAAGSVMGHGWAALLWDPSSNRLRVAQVSDHQHDLIQASRFLLVIDAWEHAYYLQYENRRSEFLAALWHVIDWDNVAERLDVAQKGPFA